MSNQAPSPFQITQAGLNAAVAEGPGVAITIARFKLSTGYGYLGTLNDTALQGTVVYTGVPEASNLIGLHTRDIVCRVPVEAGPFLFGAIGLELDDGTLFAVSTYQTLQEKVTIAVSGSANAFTLHCLLNLGSSPSVVQVNTSRSGFATEVFNTSMVSGSDTMIGSPNAVIVNEIVRGGDNLFLSRVTGTRWMVHNFVRVASGVLTAVGVSGSSLTSSLFNSTLVNPAAPAGTYLVQDNQGNVRVVNTVLNTSSAGTVVLTYPLGTAASGTPVILYKTINL